MKVAVMVLNAMLLLLFVSTVIGEWGEAPAIVAGIGIFSVAINSIFIVIRTKGDFEN